MSLTLPTKEGYLYKYRNIFKGWQYRYFKISKDYFHYFEAQHAPNPKSSIIRTEISDVSQSHSFPDKSNCICVTTKSHDKWYLVANSETEMREWMQVLRAHLPNADVNHHEKESLQAVDGNPPSPTVTPPPLPRYMAEIQSNPEMPPSYEDCVKHKT